MLEFSDNGSLADLTDIVENVPFSEGIKGQMKSSDGNSNVFSTSIYPFTQNSFANAKQLF